MGKSIVEQSNLGKGKSKLNTNGFNTHNMFTVESTTIQCDILNPILPYAMPLWPLVCGASLHPNFVTLTVCLQIGTTNIFTGHNAGLTLFAPCDLHGGGFSPCLPAMGERERGFAREHALVNIFCRSWQHVHDQLNATHMCLIGRLLVR